MVLGSLGGGVAAYLFQIVGARALGGAGYAPIGVLWTLQYLAFTIGLIPVEAFVTRGEAGGDAPASIPLRLWVVGLAAAGGLASWAARQPLFGDPGLAFPAATAWTVLGFGAFAIARGRLAGRRCFRDYGAVTAAESGLRLAAAIAVLAAGLGAAQLAFTLPAGAVVVAAWWLGVRRSSRAAAADDEPTAVVGTGAAPYLAATTFANASSQTLLAAGPLVVAAMGAGAAATSMVFVTVTAARAPLVLAFGGLLSRVLPPLTRMARAGRRRRLVRIARVTAVVGLLVAAAGGAAGAALGPWLISLLFGAGFAPSAVFAGLTGAGVVATSTALLLGQVLIALGDERRLVGPWAAALLVAAAVVLLGPATPVLRVGVATVAGVGVAVLGLAVAVRPGDS